MSAIEQIRVPVAQLRPDRAVEKGISNDSGVRHAQTDIAGALTAYKSSLRRSGMLSIRNVSKSYGSKLILDALSLEVPEGKITTLLGPSGCGKTTLLRLIAGLDRPQQGEIAFNDRVWASAERRMFVPPQKRNIGLVFQSYAIWPHMKVSDQIAYPLRNRRVDPAAIDEKVDRLLRIVGLEGLGDRPATALSGGQQQRVAMARALAPDPTLLLLDEPFSNLDVSLRGQLRAEVRELQRRLGITVVLVTHDQLDAFTLSDQVALMREGHIEQLGTCEEIYERPASDFVRAFVGKSVRLTGAIAEQGANSWVLSLTDSARLRLPNALLPADNFQGNVTVWLRPEDLHISRRSSDEPTMRGIVRDTIYLGERYECVVDLAIGETVVLHTPRAIRPRTGEEVYVTAFEFSAQHAAAGERDAKDVVLGEF